MPPRRNPNRRHAAPDPNSIASRVRENRRAVTNSGITKKKAFKKPNRDTLSWIASSLTSAAVAPHYRYPAGNTLCITQAASNILGSSLAIRTPVVKKFYEGKCEGKECWRVIAMYLQYVCNYINHIDNNHELGDIPVCTTLPVNFFQQYMEAFAGDVPDSFRGNRLEWAAPVGRNAACQALIENTLGRPGYGLNAADFMQIKHIFIIVPKMKNSSLLVVSPLAKTVEYLDSAGHRGDYEITVTLDFVARRVGEAFKPYQWKIRQGRSPLQPKERPGQEVCQPYAMTSAMMIAFGEDIDYHDCNMKNRRIVITNQLLDAAPFFHSVLTLEEYRKDEWYFEPNEQYWSGRGANGIERGFVAIPRDILADLDEEVRYRDYV